MCDMSFRERQVDLQKMEGTESANNLILDMVPPYFIIPINIENNNK